MMTPMITIPGEKATKLLHLEELETSNIQVYDKYPKTQNISIGLELKPRYGKHHRLMFSIGFIEIDISSIDKEISCFKNLCKESFQMANLLIFVLD